MPRSLATYILMGMEAFTQEQFQQHFAPLKDRSGDREFIEDFFSIVCALQETIFRNSPGEKSALFIFIFDDKNSSSFWWLVDLWKQKVDQVFNLFDSEKGKQYFDCWSRVCACDLRHFSIKSSVPPKYNFQPRCIYAC